MIQKARRVPFSLKDKVTSIVNDLLEQDIIERLQGPTAWVCPIVVAPKASGDIRLRVDICEGLTRPLSERDCPYQL